MVQRAEAQKIVDIDSLTINTTEPIARFPHSQLRWSHMQPIPIDPELNRQALAEAAEQHPEFAGQAVQVIARPLLKGFAWQLEWKGEPPIGQPAWEFQNTAIRAYKRLAKIS
jgi:hypothetical protein